MSCQEKAKLLRAGDAVLLGQDVDSVLLGVGGDDVAVVPGLVVLVVVEGEQSLHFQLADGVDRALLGDVEDLHTSLQRFQLLKSSLRNVPYFAIFTVDNFEALNDHGGGDWWWRLAVERLVDWRETGGLERELPAGCLVDTAWIWLSTTCGQV